MSKFFFLKKYTFCVSYMCLSTFIILCALAFARAGVVKVNEAAPEIESVASVQKSKITVILDAGHGGEDAGASSDSGLLEKDLNLKICENIRDILICAGIDVRMTRTEDALLYTEEQNIKGQRKHYDLKNRYLIACEYENPVFVSVHINKFTQSQYKGLQVYYSDNNPESKVLADTIQSEIKLYLQNENNRKTKNAHTSIYLLDRLECPAVLVECGFLSNAEDCENLSDDEYIKKMSAIISNAIMENLE